MSSSSEGDSKGDTIDSKEVEDSSNTGQRQDYLESSPPPQSMILPGYYPAQYSRQQAGYTSPEVGYYYQQQQSYRASIPATSSTSESAPRRDSPVYFGRSFLPQQQQPYGGAPRRVYDAAGSVPSVSDSGGTHQRGSASEVDLGAGGVAGAAAAAASLLYQSSYPGGKVSYNPNYPMGGSPSQTGYPEGLSRRMTPPQQALYQQTAPLSHMHGVPSVYPQYAAAQGALGYLSGPDRHPGMIPLDDPSASLDSNAPIEGLPDRSTSTPGSYYRASATPSAVEAARALGAPSGGSFYPQQSPPWYGMPDPYQQPGLSSGQLGYSDSPYVSYQGATFPNPGPPIQTTPFNKGPEGANLFVFHIPNDMTNQTMYEMFAPFGNLLSVRIMVEKDTGRSRGFGFVSYDSPESAAAAIKALNGHIIGNKRLKVQHKQIRGHDKQGRKKTSSPFFQGPIENFDDDDAEVPSSLDSMRALLSHQADMSNTKVPMNTEINEKQGSATGAVQKETQQAISDTIAEVEPNFSEPSRQSPSLDGHESIPSFDVSQLRNDLPD